MVALLIQSRGSARLLQQDNIAVITMITSGKLMKAAVVKTPPTLGHR